MGKDMVNHPPHYEGKVECIDALESATAGLEGIEAVDTANAIKYLWRWKKKNGKEDLKKAIWYINHLLQHLGEPEEKPKELPQPQLSDVCEMTPCEFMREFVNGRAGVVGSKFYLGEIEYRLYRFDCGRSESGRTTKVDLEFVRNTVERPDYFYQITRDRSMKVMLREEVLM